MNILQIDDELWDSGITSYALELSLGLKEKGHKVLFGGLDGKSPIIQAQEKGLDILRLRSKMDFFNLREAILKNDIDLINCHTGSSHFLTWMVLLSIPKRDITLVRTKGDIRPPRINRLLYKNTRCVICASEFIKRGFLARGKIDEERLVTIYPGIDTEVFSPREVNYNGDLITIVGRLDPIKGHKFFLEGFALAKMEKPTIKALLVGEEKNIRVSELKKFCEHLGIENDVTFRNSREYIPSVMKESHIGVISSVGSEAISRVLLEWMACAKPIIATSVGCIPEIIEDGENGFVVQPKNPGKLQEKILYLLENSKEYIQIGKRARESVLKNFSKEVFVSRTEEVYKKVLKSKK